MNQRKQAEKTKEHAHQWVPSHAAILSEGYPNFIVRYVCMTEENPCDEERWEIVEGFEL